MVSKFTQYAAEKSNRMFLGTLVKFVKGEWEEGRDRIPISPGKRFVAVMDTVTVGHMKWFGGKVVGSRMGLIADGFHPAHRNELDDLDSATWETDEYGDRKDPWQKTTLLVLASATAPHDLFTFTTGTVGGEDAVAALCGAHGETTEGVGQYPVVMPPASDLLRAQDQRLRGRIDASRCSRSSIPLRRLRSTPWSLRRVAALALSRRRLPRLRRPAHRPPSPAGACGCSLPEPPGAFHRGHRDYAAARTRRRSRLRL